jgi:hypothetical protein
MAFNIAGMFAGWKAQGAAALNIFGWVMIFVIIFGTIFYLLLYLHRHPYPVKIIDLRTTGAGNFIGKRIRDKGGIYVKRGVPYLHLMKRFGLRNLREPLPHERDFDGEITVLRLADNYYTYAPSRLYMIKRPEQGEHQNPKPNRNILMQPNPDYDPKKPKGNQGNEPFMETKDDSVEFTEGYVRQLVDESQKDAFRTDFRNVLETTTRKKDTTGLWINLGLFAINATIFVLIMVLTGK